MARLSIRNIIGISDVLSLETRSCVMAKRGSDIRYNKRTTSPNRSDDRVELARTRVDLAPDFIANML